MQSTEFCRFHNCVRIKYGSPFRLYLLYAFLFCRTNSDSPSFHFSLLFALNAIAIGAGALLAVRFSTTAKATYFGTAGSLIAAVLGLVFGLTTKDLYTYEGSVLLMVFA